MLTLKWTGAHKQVFIYKRLSVFAMALTTHFLKFGAKGMNAILLLLILRSCKAMLKPRDLPTLNCKAQGYIQFLHIDPRISRLYPKLGLTSLARAGKVCCMRVMCS